MVKSKPAPIGDILKKTIETIEGGRQPFYKEDIRKIWEGAAGKAASRHSTPYGLKKGVLIINVDSPVWIYQLNMKKGEIEQKLSRRMGRKKGIKIRLRAGEEDGSL